MQLFNFENIIGHNNTKEYLKSKLKQDSVPQILMFSGLPGIGKTSIAKILACELACKDTPERLAEVKQKIIADDTNTDCVHLYNMSNLRNQDAVLEVKNDLTVGLSSTGRKVIIMDEAHGMSNEAQDSLLVRFESLERGVYIIICTTETTAFRDAFLSRCIMRHLTTPTYAEITQLANTLIDEKHIEFTIGKRMALAYILSYCNMEPRRVINVINSFDANKAVTKEELISFGVAADDATYFRLIYYLFNSNIVDGLKFISENKAGFSKTAITLYIEMVKVALGGESLLISKDIALQLMNASQSSKNKLIRFTVMLTQRSKPDYNYIAGVYMSCCIDLHSAPEQVRDTHMADLNVMNKTEQYETNISQNKPTATTLEELFSNADILK